MLGALLKKWEQSTLPENSKAINEARELRERVNELEEGMETLRNQVRETGHEPRA